MSDDAVTDSELLTTLKARVWHGDTSHHTAIPVAELRRLVGLVERQRELLDECAIVLAHDYESFAPELCPGWDELDYEERGSYLAKAVLSLLLEVRRA